MRSKLLLLFFLFGVGLNVKGQIAVGAKAGINFNSFRGNKSFDVIPGYSIGAFGKYKALDFLSARLEVLYAQQGANLLDYSLMGELKRNHAVVRFHTLQIPVIAEFGLPALSEETLQPKVLLGGFYSFVMSATEPHENEARLGGYDPIKYNGYSDVSAQFADKQYGWLIGAAAEIKVFATPVALEFRYNHNLNPISKSETRTAPNLTKTFDEWGDTLYLGTVSFNVAVTIQYF